MAILTYFIAYAAIGIFVIAVVARVAMWLKMPIHVRWELYPVAHEAKRAHYGGSYLEDVGWWSKPREVSMAGELKVMVPEILFLEALFKNNRSLWFRSFPFHFGLYMVITCTALLMLGGVLGAVAPALFSGGLGNLLHFLIVATGAVGLCLGIIGALGLLQRRLTDPNLIDFTSPADIFNLLFFVVAFGLAFVNFILVDRDFAKVSFFVSNLVTFKMAALPGQGLEVILPQASAVVLGLLVAYIPLTHMSHFIGKYFAYHAIRWNDEPNLRGGPQEAPIQAVLGQKVSWAAQHIQGGGTKTWVDVATEVPKK